MNGWQLRYDGWDPARQSVREALTTLGNGNFATRGAFEEARAGGPHYPGTYLAGGYDRIASEVRGEIVVNEDLVNFPNWLYLTFRPEGGEWLALERFDVLGFEQVLHLREGLLVRRVHFRDRDGRESRLVSRRLVSMANPHLAAISWELTPLDWSGPLELRSGLDGSVTNAGVARYGELRGRHLVRLRAGPEPDGTLALEVETHQSRIRLAQVARTRVDGPVRARRTDPYVDQVMETLTLDVTAGQTIRVEKTVALHSSLSLAGSEPLSDARRVLREAGDFDALLAAHRRAWARIWRRCDIRVAEENRSVGCNVRLHVFHLTQVASPHVADRDVGVPARGLHGEAYRGHVFWDELFIFPFLNYAIPELTRELLMYRHRRLDAARRIARDNGFQGALYPWQSGSTGREESQVLHLNPRSGRWVPDETHLQRHIDAAIAFNVWQYFQATDDREFLSTYGAEMVLEIARFWASIAAWDPEKQRYRIRGVVGPDEYHTGLPDRTEPGLDDNAYTNVMAAWCLRLAERALAFLAAERREELLGDLGITDEDRTRWQEIATRIYVPFVNDHVISQFEGYAELPELDWAAYRERYGDIQRLDRILEAENDTPNRYKASKQADVLMLFYLFSADELVELMGELGYRFEPEWIPENVEYYMERTSHGSTLSRVVHSWVLSRADRAGSWHLFTQALRSDLEDIQGGTTAEGIHLGAMAGAVDMLQRGYLGAVIREGVLWLNPRLPDELVRLYARFRVQGAWLDVQADKAQVEVRYASGWPPVARLGFQGSIHEIPLGEVRTWPMKQHPTRNPPAQMNLQWC